MAEEHQEYREKKVYPLVERLVTKTLKERPDLPVPFMVKWLAEETQRPIPTPEILLAEEIKELRREVRELEALLDAPPGELEARVSPRSPAPLQEPPNGGVWGFSLGPDLDPETLAARGIRVFEATPAVVKGWMFTFCREGIPRVEPAFAGLIRGTSADEAHGLALWLAEEDLQKIDSLEAGCVRVEAELSAYDGRVKQGFIHASRSRATRDQAPPSQRHLDALIKWAGRANLSAAWIDKLAGMATFRPSAVAQQIRAALPEMGSLPQVTCEELSAMADEDEVCHVSCLGYVVRVPKAKIFVGSHRGRDVTARALRQWRGLPLDEGDDFGKPPYPSLASMGTEELEYVYNWLDHYLWAAGGPGHIVGFLAEFRQQREQEALDT